MSSEKSVPLYAATEEHLSQGDIFCCHVLGTFAGTDLKILRTKDGARPSQTFTSAGEVDFVNAASVYQFEATEEIVLCQVEHFNYFVIASQTCDVAGADHEGVPTCLVLKMTPFCDFVNQGSLPFQWREESGETSIKILPLRDFLASNVGEGAAAVLKKCCADRLAYPGALRAALKSWKPTNNSNESAFKNKLQNFLTAIANNKEGRTFYLPPNEELSVPESFVDFSSAFPISLREVYNVKDKRLATLANPYKEEFSQRLGTRLSRVAVPEPVRGEKF